MKLKPGQPRFLCGVSILEKQFCHVIGAPRYGGEVPCRADLTTTQILLALIGIPEYSFSVKASHSKGTN